MDYKKVLTIQDISCVGQCSLTVALPIISAAGHETAVLPSAVLSTHTAGFKNFTFRDLCGDMPAITNHWVSEKIAFDCVYTGYLGSKEQVGYVLDIFNRVTKKDAIKIVDPAFADGGKLYPIFDMNYVNEMKKLISASDITVPNISEASFLTGIEYKEEYDKEYVIKLMKALCNMGAKSVVITGVGYSKGKTGVAVLENDNYLYYEHEKMPNSCHGTGDVFAAAFTGAVMCGRDLLSSAKIAADYTLLCMKNTIGDSEHWYGVKFEPILKDYIKML